MTRARGAWLLAAGAWALGHPVVATAAAEEAPRTRPQSVQVYVAGTLEAIARTRVTARELFARLELPVIVRDASDDDESVLDFASPNALVVSFIDLRDAAATRIVVVDGRTHKELERRTLPGSSLEMSVEAATHVLYVAAESSLGAREQQAEGRASQPPSPQATEDRRERRWGPWQVDLSAFGRAAAFSDARLLGGFGASVDAGPHHGSLRPALLLGLGAYAPRALSRGTLSASLGAAGARLMATIEWQPASMLTLFGGGGGGVDGVRVTTGQTPAGTWTADTDSRIDPILAGVLGAKIHLSSAIAALAGMAMDVDISPHHYVAEVNGEKIVLFDLARVRPGGFLGISISVPATRPRSVEGVGE